MARTGTGSGGDGADVSACRCCSATWPATSCRDWPGRTSRVRPIARPAVGCRWRRCRPCSPVARPGWPSVSATPDAGWAIGCFSSMAANFSMPDTPELREHFGQAPRDKPRAAVSCRPTGWHLVHSARGLIQKAIVVALQQPRPPSVPHVHPELEPGDVVVGDRAFCSFGHFALLLVRGSARHLSRASETLIIDFTPTDRTSCQRRNTRRVRARASRHRAWIESLGRRRSTRQWIRPRTVPAWFTAEAWAALPGDPDPPRVAVHDQTPRLSSPQRHTGHDAARPPDPLPKDELARAYGLRWHIETCFGHLKTTMRMDVMRCQTVPGRARKN